MYHCIHSFLQHLYLQCFMNRSTFFNLFFLSHIMWPYIRNNISKVWYPYTVFNIYIISWYHVLLRMDCFQSYGIHGIHKMYISSSWLLIFHSLVNETRIKIYFVRPVWLRSYKIWHTDSENQCSVSYLHDVLWFH